MPSSLAALPRIVRTAVIVDDSKIGRFFARNAFTRAGWAVLAEGATGTEAVRLYEMHRPSLMLLDVVLPEMDGLAAAREILARYPEAKLVMCSAFAAREQVLEAHALGVASFLVKPLSAEKLVSVAGEVLVPAGGKP